MTQLFAIMALSPPIDSIRHVEHMLRKRGKKQWDSDLRRTVYALSFDKANDIRRRLTGSNAYDLAPDFRNAHVVIAFTMNGFCLFYFSRHVQKGCTSTLGASSPVVMFGWRHDAYSS